MVTGPPTVLGWDLNPGPLNFEASALLTELTRPDDIVDKLCCNCFMANACTASAGN